MTPGCPSALPLPLCLQSLSAGLDACPVCWLQPLKPLLWLWDSECREGRAANLISAFFIPQPKGLPPLPSKPYLSQAGKESEVIAWSPSSLPLGNGPGSHGIGRSCPQGTATGNRCRGKRPGPVLLPYEGPGGGPSLRACKQCILTQAPRHSPID